MTCDELEPLLPLYADGEFADGERREVEGHLATCDDCRGAVEFQRAYKARMRSLREEAGPSTPAPSALRASILAGLSAPENEPASVQQKRRAAYRVPMAAATALALCGGVVLYVKSRAGDPTPFLNSAIAHHQRDLPLEVENADLPKVQSWFKGKVDFSPTRIPTLRKVNLIGARLSNITDHQAAYVAYSPPAGGNGHGRVSLFVFDAPDLRLEGARRVKDHEVLIANQKGYNVAIWKDQEIAYSLVSDLNEQDILELVEAANSR